MKRSARRLRANHTKNKVRKFGILFKVLLPLAILIFAVVFFKIDSKYWNGKDKVAFVSPDSKGDVEITVLDPKLGEETVFVIPGETQVDVARGYGILRIKNVWQLGINENLNGSLLSQTVTQNFLFPNILWSQTGLGQPTKFVFSPGKTNISFSDRLLMTFFALKVKSIDKTVIDLGKNQFLKKQNLTDGQSGYVIGGPISGRLTVFFSDNSFADKNTRFSLTDATGRPGVADSVGEILEVMGGKVAAIDRQKTDDSLDCTVFGQNADAVKKIAVLFSCRKVSDKSDFDAEMRMGSKFAKRY